MKNHIINIEAKIQAACDRSGRYRSEITLIAVSKTKPLEMIKEAYELGLRHFGENKVQELTNKYDILQEAHPDISWHQIGHLQRNKVKYIVSKAALIHSVDSIRLAEQIEEEAAKRGQICDVLIEVNITNEESKYGVKPEELFSIVTELLKLEHLRLRGLMTVAANTEDPENNRMYFRKMRELYVDIKTKNIDNSFKENKVNFPHGNISLNMDETTILKNNHGLENFNILSMGMTGDFEVAIEEGATMVRIGTGIFGERNYNNIVKE